MLFLPDFVVGLSVCYHCYLDHYLERYGWCEIIGRM